MATMNSITNRAALHMAIKALEELGCENENLLKKLDTMAKAADKRAENAKKSPRAKSKDQIQREERAKEAAEKMKAHGKPVTTDWVIENVPGLITADQGAGCMRTAINLGIVEKAGYEKVNGKPRVTYQAIQKKQKSFQGLFKPLFLCPVFIWSVQSVYFQF